MKKSFSALAVVFAGLLSVSANAATAEPAVAITGDIHGGNGITYRGNALSDDNFSLGLKIKAAHESGVYASVNSDLIKVEGLNPQATDKTGRQTLNSFTLGYDHQLGDAVVGAGFTRNAFSGTNEVGDLSHSEVFVSGAWNGFHGKLSRVITGSELNTQMGFNKGDMYTELGYTHQLGQFTLGADLGYAWHKNDLSDKDGHQFTQLRAGYAVNDNLSLQLTHQFDAGKGTAKDTTHVKVSYSF